MRERTSRPRRRACLVQSLQNNASRRQIRSRLSVLIPLIECIKNQLDAAADAQLAEDPVQLVPDRALGNFQPLGNFAVFQAVGNQPDGQVRDVLTF